ncbi:MFS transporter [Alteribacillus sp. HJP-4]|uniref:MFS transporter n=1 Tax=Alteribacillus sp. HJP-4 TaxID=2775394 RepID=UPI0035CCEA7F
MPHDIKRQTAGRLMCILVLTLVLSVMSATMFNIVLPEMALDLNLSYAQVSWVSSVYMLIYGIGTVIYGKLADSYKLKNLLTFGLIFFSLGSLVGLMSQAYWMVLLGRILQAVGAAVIPASAMIIPVRYFPQEKRGQALGLVAASLALGRVLGPVVPAFIMSVADWRWLFCLPLFTLFLLPLFRKYLDDEERDSGNIDWIGGGLFGGTIALLLLSVTEGGWLLVIGSLMLLFLFIVRIQRTAEPFIQPSLFKNKRYSLGVLIAFLTSASGFSIPFLSPLLLSSVNHLSPEGIGVVMVPGAIISALLSKKGGQLADRRGNSILFYTATTLLLISLILLSSFAGMSPVYIAVILILGDLGQAFVLVALANSISRTLTERQIGVGMGFLQMMNFLAGSVSGAVYGRFVDVGASVTLNPMNTHSGAFVYSNIYITLAGLMAAVLLLYHFQISKTGKHYSKVNQHPKIEEIP